MDNKILYNYIKILEKYIQYNNQYNDIKYNNEIYNNGFILLNNVFLLLFRRNINKDKIYNLLDKSYVYYIEFINNVDLLNISHNNNKSNIQMANIFCIKKIFLNLNKENDINDNNLNDNIFYDKLYIIINIITNIYIKIYCYFNNYNERYIFNNIIIEYISTINKDNNSNDNNIQVNIINRLEKLLHNINNHNLNLEIKQIISKYNSN